MRLLSFYTTYNRKRKHAWWLVICCMLAVTACKKTNLLVKEEHTGTIRPLGDFIRNNYDLSLLAAAMEKTGLLDTLNSTGPFTILAPDNSAFNNMGISKPEDFDRMNKDSLRFMMRYCLLPGRLYTTDFPIQMDMKYTTLSGAITYISTVENFLGPNADDRPMTMNGCQVKQLPKRNIPVINGVVHIISDVVKYRAGTIQDYLATDTSLALIVQLLKQTSQWDALKGKGPLTVFVPNNDVLRSYNLTSDSIAKINPAHYVQEAFGIYTLDLTPRHIFSRDLFLLGGSGTSVNYIRLGEVSFVPDRLGLRVINRKGLSGQLGPSEIRYTQRGSDVMVDNGVVHQIDNLLIYPDSLLLK
ncbi:MAG TPA: fasciclin domain-containing protein [Chitinophaga sp.]|uniref:fasciclin domain-containing protein n=1 Tax=Chitinophaga sp. TaxID=1869181 RepID=UPI002B89F2F9|nr:fasciclin domain-containing protein [Chitinophaga sp.]HVI44040.1 fasciclin domain-containing protein [Chitinophaga sp.]